MLEWFEGLSSLQVPHISFSSALSVSLILLQLVDLFQCLKMEVCTFLDDT